MSGTGQPPDRGRPVVEVTDVFVAYRSGAEPVMALRGADLTLAAGERLLVAGPNGSGKSTLLRVVTGDQAVLAGRVEVGGAAVHAMDAGERRRWRSRALGFVDQHARRNLLPELDVRDNVALQLRLTGTRTAPARARAEQTLDRLGLGHLARADVRRLSGGEAQRVALCAAVAHGPALVLADEPTGELDEDAAHQVYGLLEAVAADGTGVILVSHDPRSDALRGPGRPAPRRPAGRGVGAGPDGGRPGRGQPWLGPGAGRAAHHRPGTDDELDRPGRRRRAAPAPGRRHPGHRSCRGATADPGRGGDRPSGAPLVELVGSGRGGADGRCSPGWT